MRYDAGVDWSARYQISRALTVHFAGDGQLYASSSLSRELRHMQIDAVPVVAAFAPPRTVAEAYERLRADYEFDRDGFEVVVGALIAANALTPVEMDERYVPGDSGFASLGVHFAMLRDVRRVQSYQLAIERAAPGKIVVEVGCGTGILSTLAAKAGARKVYAIEETVIGEVAREVFAANGVADRVELVVGNSMDIELPERGELLVHEIIGTEPIGENVLPVIDDARERFLVPGGQLLPFQLDLCLVGIEYSRPDELADETIAVDELSKIYGVLLDPFAVRLREQRAKRVLSRPADALAMRHVMTAEATFATIDFRKAWDPQLPGGVREVELRVTRGGRIGGVASLFRAHLDDRTVLGNQPWLASTSWGYAWKGFPIDSAREVTPGDRLVLQTKFERTAREMTISVRPR